MCINQILSFSHTKLGQQGAIEKVCQDKVNCDILGNKLPKYVQAAPRMLCSMYHFIRMAEKLIWAEANYVQNPRRDSDIRKVRGVQIFTSAV